jgi:hypothetical protein
MSKTAARSAEIRLAGKKWNRRERQKVAENLEGVALPTD